MGTGSDIDEMTLRASKRILVVEDEWLVRDMVAQELAGVGYRVIECETADEAAKLLDKEKPDLLLTDIRLPGRLDGWDLAELARERLPSLPVIYATAYSTEAARPVADSVLIRKPYRLPEIVSAVSSLLKC